MAQTQTDARPLPGVPATIGAGFDLVTRNLWLVAIPVALDVFLWLGPRLSFRPLIEELIVQMPTDALLMDPRPSLELIADRTNLFTYLSVLLAGVPALMTGITPERTPLATRTLEISNWGEWAGGILGLTLLGLLLTAVYYTLIARAAAAPTGSQSRGLVSHSLRSFGRLLGLAILFIVLLIIIVVPLIIMAAFIGLLSQAAATIVLLAVPVVVLWLLLFLSLTPRGMVINQQPFIPALVDSVRLFRANMPHATALMLLTFGISRLVGALMLTADDGSWLTLASLIGHAFIMTSLVAAAFIFYRDRYAATFQTANTGQPPTIVEHTQ